MRFLKIKRFCELTGYTPEAVQTKISRGVWMEGWQYRRAPDNVILVDVEGFNRWVEGATVA